MKKQKELMWLTTGLVAGAAAMWFLDPRSGPRRRAQVRDKANRLSHSTYDALYRALRRSKHRMIGIYARAIHKPQPQVDDDKLTSLVRSEFGRKIRHAKSIQSQVTSGVVTLTGPILKDEVQSLLDCVSQVPGVKGVVNQLEIHDVPARVSALQGRGKAYLQ